MPALKLYDVPARVVAWHNRHPLARRIDLSDVHSIGGVGLPFASDRPLPDDSLPTPADPPTAAAAPSETASLAQAPSATPAPAPAADGAAIDAASLPPENAAPAPVDTAAEQAHALVDAPTVDDPPAAVADPATPEGGDGQAPSAQTPATEASDTGALDATDAASPDAGPAPSIDVAADAEVASEAEADAEADAGSSDGADDDAEPELVMTLDDGPNSAAEPAGKASAGGKDDGASAEPAADASAATQDDADPFDEPIAAPAESTAEVNAAGQPSGVDDGAQDIRPPDNALAPAAASGVSDGPAGAGTSPDDSDATQAAGATTAAAAPAAAGSLAQRLEAARTAAQGDGPSAAAASPALDLPWWRRLWLRLWSGAGPSAAETRRASPKPAAGVPGLASLAQGHTGSLSPLFDRRLLGSLAPKAIAAWARRHGARQSLAPAGWPQRWVKPDVGLLNRARSSKQPHLVQLHLITAAVEVDGRRMRVLLDAEGQLLGARMLSPLRVGSAVTAAAMTIGLGGWAGMAYRAQAMPDATLASADHGLQGKASAPAAHVAARAGVAASQLDGTELASGAIAAASAASAASGASGASAATASTGAAAASANLARAVPDAAPSPAMHDQASGPTPATGMPAPDAPVAALQPAGSAGQFIITTTPPPAFPQRRASGPLVNIRPTLTAEQREQALQQAARVRSGMPPGLSDAAAPAGAQAEAAATGNDSAAPAPLSADRYFAVVTEGTPQRESAEARVAQMLSVRAQLTAPLPSNTELLQLGKLWHAAQWPFTDAAQAEKARTLMTARGLKAEVVQF